MWGLKPCPGIVGGTVGVTRLYPLGCPYRVSVNLFTLVGLSLWQVFKGGPPLAVQQWSWPAAGLGRSRRALPCITVPCEALWGTAAPPGGVTKTDYIDIF